MGACVEPEEKSAIALTQAAETDACVPVTLPLLGRVVRDYIPLKKINMTVLIASDAFQALWQALWQAERLK